MKILENKTLTNFINKPQARKVASMICNHKALLPVAILETAVIAGRTYHAYQRGGVTEARERIIDESLTALVWFGVISWLNAGFGKLIKQKGIFDKKGLPEIDIDLGKDEIRNPIAQAIKKRPEIQNKIGSLKFTKIAISALAGIYLSGVVLPKFYQGLTARILRKEKAEKIAKEKNSSKVSMDDFLKRTSRATSPSFGNAGAFVNTAAHVLENNAIAKLLTIDLGLFAGRAYSSRNADERFEFLFRDFISSFFYMFSTPLIYLGLSKYVDKFHGKNTGLDQNTAHFISQRLSKLVGSGMDLETYKKEVLGTGEDSVAKILPKIKGEITDIEKFKRIVKTTIADNQKANEIIENATKFIKLRPEGASRNLLTMSEIINSVQGGKSNSAEFLTNALAVATNGTSQTSKKFISFTELDKIKININKYVQSIADFAESRGKEKITAELLTQARNRNFIAKLAYTLVGMGVSAAFLASIIPKIQYKVTEMRTGNKDFPGIKDIK